jgi:hypothetical protein
MMRRRHHEATFTSSGERDRLPLHRTVNDFR